MTISLDDREGRREAVDAFLETLPAHDQELLRAEMNGENISERARRLGRPAAADRQQVVRLKRRLRAWIEKALATPPEDEAPDLPDTLDDLDAWVLTAVMQWLRAHPEDPLAVGFHEHAHAWHVNRRRGDDWNAVGAWVPLRRCVRAIEEIVWHERRRGGSLAPHEACHETGDPRLVVEGDDFWPHELAALRVILSDGGSAPPA